MYHLFLCDEFSAEEAYRCGFVQEVHPYGKHRERAMEIARQICKVAPIGLRWLGVSRACKASGNCDLSPGLPMATAASTR